MPTSAKPAEGFLRSCLAVDADRGAQSSLQEVRQWLESERQASVMRVARIAFREMDAWSFSKDRPLRLAHRSGRFFTVEGIRFRTPSTGRVWEQPVLNQPEVGLLGFLMAVFDGVPHFLVQAKWEPGNRAPQLSPTVQATHSNYTRAHGGREQPFLDHFVPARPESTVFDVLMPEHGAYFLRKWNRNAVVQVATNLAVPDGFRWVTLGQIKALLAEDGVVHMDSRSVLACLPLGVKGAGDYLVRALELDDHAAAVARSASVRDGIEELETWLGGPQVEVESRSLDALTGWTLDVDAIRKADGAAGDFSIIAVSVEASRRELTRWTQPLIAPSGEGFLGLLTTTEAGILSLLVEARSEPGLDGSAQVFPSVATDDLERSPLAREFRRAASTAVFSARNSEEGGRFFHYDNRHLIIDATRASVGTLPSTHRWLALGQIEELARRGRVSMELRNLLAALPLSTPA